MAPVVHVWFMQGVSDKFITCSEDGTIRLWDSNNYTVKARCTIKAKLGNHYPNHAIFTDEIIISGWTDGVIRAFRIDNSQQLWEIPNAHKGGVTVVCLSNSYKFIVSGGNEGDVRVWDIKSRELISHLKEHSSRVTKV